MLHCCFDAGGVPHDTYAMTTTSVHTYVTELLRELGEDNNPLCENDEFSHPWFLMSICALFAPL